MLLLAHRYITFILLSIAYKITYKLWVWTSLPHKCVPLIEAFGSKLHTSIQEKSNTQQRKKYGHR